MENSRPFSVKRHLENSAVVQVNNQPSRLYHTQAIPVDSHHDKTWETPNPTIWS